MAQVQQRVPPAVPRPLLALALGVALAWPAPAAEPRFYPDDPLETMPPPLPVGKVAVRKVDNLYDFARQSFRGAPKRQTPAQAVNTLGEVPDSAWFTNRHGRRRMTLEELRRGPGDGSPPVPPLEVVGGKTEGSTPGFRMRDSRGRLYYVKTDPPEHPEMATAADVIGARFFHAFGYSTPQNYLLYLKRSDLTVAPRATVSPVANRPRPMMERDLDDILRRLPRRPDGTWRLLASLEIAGESAGAFRYEGVRADDPNDIFPHQDRRDLRGLAIFCAWLNHTDVKGANSVDVVVEENGVRFLRHYLIDFGSILGSDGDGPKNTRHGHAYWISTQAEGLKKIFTLGLIPEPWEKVHYPKAPAVGRFEATLFHPGRWRPNYPNPAFLARLPDDEFWAAKIVMAFTDEDIRAIVETGEYSDPGVEEYVISTLIARRDKIGEVCFDKVLPLDRFRVEGDELRFEDLAVQYGFRPPRKLAISWSRFDNANNRHRRLSGAAGPTLPRAALDGPDGSYWPATIRESAQSPKSVTVYLRKQAGAFTAVGIDRTW